MEMRTDTDLCLWRGFQVAQATAGFSSTVTPTTITRPSAVRSACAAESRSASSASTRIPSTKRSTVPGTVADSRGSTSSVAVASFSRGTWKAPVCTAMKSLHTRPSVSLMRVSMIASTSVGLAR